MAFSKITTRGMSGDTLEAGDIAPNAIGASELADNAVDTDAIAATSITEAKLNADVTDGSAITTAVKSHIQPGTLYPAYKGLLEDNTGSQNITDSGTGSHALTVVGTAHHSGVQKKVGSTSLRFDGASRVVVPASTDWDLPNDADWTFECWVYMRDPTTNWGRIIAKDSDNNGWALHMNGGTGQVQFGHDSTSFASGDMQSNSNSAITANTWTHIAVVHDDSANNFKLYKDGTAVIEKTGIANYWSSTNKAIRIGDRYNGAYHFDGFLDQIRISNSQRYSSNFTPSTSAFTSDSNTKLLIQSDAGGHSGAYGTAQSDGRSYYYTDIKGSKPIKDPRIGAYFGHQRNMFSSLQTLEQETGAHGSNVYSVDGREWIRRAGNNWSTVNGNNGYWYYVDNGAAEDSNFWEITGYFNAANWLSLSPDSANDVNISIDGTKNSSAFAGATGAASPIANGRYINAYSVIALPFDSTPSLGIHTLKLSNENGDYMRGYGVDLIAQDTSSTANKSKIQIPSQNVVSYGKKFSVSGTPHYNPFAFKTDGSTAWASGAHNGTSWPVGTGSSANIDTATSLGLENWKHSSNYYKPYNGGRVVVWVASDGTIKTSVNVMPPNARSAGNSSSLTNATAKANASIANNTFYPTMEAGAIDHSLSEVAKTYHWREFGNGAANTGTGGSLADASMLNTTDVIAYVMDDGLTSLSGKSACYTSSTGGIRPETNGDSLYFTFIGTGITTKRRDNASGNDEHDEFVDGIQVKDGAEDAVTSEKWLTVAQNLPYGTHTYRIERTAVNAYNRDTLELTFHQPKKPPIPEDACVLADYMLMADFVPQTATGVDKISKGTRLIATSRDHFHDKSNGSALVLSAPNTSGTTLMKGGTYTYYANFTSEQGPQLTYFGDAKVVNDLMVESDAVTSYIQHFDGATTNVTVSSAYTNNGAVVTSAPSSSLGSLYIYGNKTTGEMGMQKVKILGDELGGSSDDWLYHGSTQVSTPIHTSSHYQSFETPFLKQLVGGDRNMEQTNLVVTPDGKTWDEVTRDTSYIGKLQFSSNYGTQYNQYNNIGVGDEFRGVQLERTLMNKDFAIAYDRAICLKDGMYWIHFGTHRNADMDQGHYHKILKNGVNVTLHYVLDQDHGHANGQIILQLKRGDYIQHLGIKYTDANYRFQIYRV